MLVLDTSALSRLMQAEPVALVAGAPSRYRLRREPREGGLATFEAIGLRWHALGGPSMGPLYLRGVDVMPPAVGPNGPRASSSARRFSNSMRPASASFSNSAAAAPSSGWRRT
jgi:hypothetical protein